MSARRDPERDVGLWGEIPAPGQLSWPRRPPSLWASGVPNPTTSSKPQSLCGDRGSAKASESSGESETGTRRTVPTRSPISSTKNCWPGAFDRIRKDAAVGVDGTTKEQYGQNLEANLRGLHERLKTMLYRHQPIRRVHIPKEKGKTRPIGVSTIEDKVVQNALREVLEAVYEQEFLDCSYGFRHERSAHDAVRALTKAVDEGEANWILELDIASFFDSLCRKELEEMLRKRVADGSMLRLIGKCLHVGVLDGGEYSEPEEGTVQGSTLSPLLGNVYLHYALDLWFAEEVKPRLRGKATLVRYADDAVLGFERQGRRREGDGSTG